MDIAPCHIPVSLVEYKAGKFTGLAGAAGKAERGAVCFLKTHF